MWGIFKRFRVQTGESHLEIGERGERLAADFLQKNDYRIVAANFVAPIGYNRNGRQITGEIDLIAYDESSLPYNLAFVEVKTRTSVEIALPESAVDLRKQRQIVKASRVYRRIMSIENELYRYDVVSIVLEPDKRPHIAILRGYFSEQRYEHSRWLSQKF